MDNNEVTIVHMVPDVSGTNLLHPLATAPPPSPEIIDLTGNDTDDDGDNYNTEEDSYPDDTDEPTVDHTPRCFACGTRENVNSEQDDHTYCERCWMELRPHEYLPRCFVCNGQGHIDWYRYKDPEEHEERPMCASCAHFTRNIFEPVTLA